MRELQLPDTFAIARIIKKANIKDVLVNANASLKTGRDKEDVFTDVLFSIFESACNDGVEEEIYSLLANVTEKEVEEVKKISIRELIEIAKEIMSKNDIGSFFKSALALTK